MYKWLSNFTLKSHSVQLQREEESHPENYLKTWPLKMDHQEELL